MTIKRIKFQEEPWQLPKSYPCVGCQKPISSAELCEPCGELMGGYPDAREWQKTQAFYDDRDPFRGPE